MSLTLLSAYGPLFLLLGYLVHSDMRMYVCLVLLHLVMPSSGANTGRPALFSRGMEEQ